MRFRCFASLLLLFVACTRTEIPPPVATSADPAAETKMTPVREPSAAEVQRDVRIRTEATFAGDVDTMLDYVSAKKLAEDGGREASRRTLQKALDDMREMGAKLESLTFHASPDFVTTPERTYAIVPLTGVISVRDGTRRIHSIDYHIGVREKGSDRFLDYRVGSQFGLNEIRGEYPDFPADYSFPDTSTTPLNAGDSASGAR